MVPVIGVEPIRYRYHWILSPARLPIPPHRRIKFIVFSNDFSIITHNFKKCKPFFEKNFPEYHKQDYKPTFLVDLQSFFSNCFFQPLFYAKNKNSNPLIFCIIANSEKNRLGDFHTIVFIGKEVCFVGI